MPLAKRQTNTKKLDKGLPNNQDKIDEVAYQIVEEISVITPLEVHPSQLLQDINTFVYQRKLPSVMDNDFSKK